VRITTRWVAEVGCASKLLATSSAAAIAAVPATNCRLDMEWIGLIAA
jgi:hypothetical protein